MDVWGSAGFQRPQNVGARADIGSKACSEPQMFERAEEIRGIPWGFQSKNETPQTILWDNMGD
jgi:hypothetical protein